MIMKKLFPILIALSLVLSCTSQAQKSFDTLRSDLDNSVYEELSAGALKKLSERIDTHIAAFPDFNRNGELAAEKDKILSAADDRLYKELTAAAKAVREAVYPDYESAESAYHECRDAFQQYISDGLSEKNIANAERVMDALDRVIMDIGRERAQFYSVMQSESVEMIDDFLRLYPNSVMLPMLNEKRETLLYSKFLTSFNRNPNTIAELNNCVDNARSYLDQFKSLEVIGSINELISSLESQRRPLLENELGDKLQLLIKAMEEEARSRAAREHPTYRVEMCSPRGSNPEVVGYSSTFERLYQVNMVGAFLGWNKREMAIAVSGRISGDLNSGVTWSVTGSRIDSDVKR